MSPTQDDQDLQAVMTEVAQLMAQPTPPKPRCRVDGCARERHTRGLCRTHYMRQVRTGTPGPAQIVTRPPREPTCTVDGCEHPHQARGLCRTHYSRWRRTGHTHADTPPASRRCRLAGCSQRHYRRGLCRAHFRSWQQTGVVQPRFDLAECARLYRGGASAASLGQRYGLTPRTVLDRLRPAGVPIRPPGRQPRQLTEAQPPTELPLPVNTEPTSHQP